MNSSLAELTAEEDDDVATLNFSCTGPSKIHRIEGLQRFSRLTTLNLNNHMIARIEGLGGLHQLRVLNLEFNQLRVLEGLDALLNLEELYLSYNSIRSVRQKLDLLPRLRILHLAHNQLAIESISCLAAASQLAILSLHGNPLTKQITYHTLIGLVFAKLVILDEKEVRRVEVDIMTEQVSFLRGALNQVLQEKNELLAEATKIKRQLTSQSEAAGTRKDEQSERYQHERPVNDQKQQKLFYVLALHEQNRILEQKIRECEQAVSRLRYREKALHHYQSVKIAQQLQQQTIVEQISTELERKYMETAQLEKRLERLQRDNRSRREQEKVLSQLVDNETLIRNCHEKIEAIKRQSQEHSLQEQPVQESGESAAQDELHHLESQLERFREKLEENLNVIRQYREELKTSRCADDSHPYHRLVFGECSEEFTLQDVREFAEKYPAGLLPTLGELFTLTFGKYVQLHTIKELAERLDGKPLIQFVLDRRDKSSGKGKFSSKKAFLEEKFNFIREFERETKELAEQWTLLSEQKQLFEAEMEAKRVKFYQELELKMRAQQEDHRQHMAEERQQHQRAISHLAEEEMRRMDNIRQIEQQIEQLTAHFETKFRQLEEFERNFAQLKAEKSNLALYHSEIERMKEESVQLSERLVERQKQLVEVEQQEQLLQGRVEALEKKSNERLNGMLEIDSKHKELAAKLSQSVAEHNQVLQRIEAKENELRVLQDETKDYERNMERAKVNYGTWEEKLSNLQALEVSKRESLSDLDKQASQLDEAIKARLSINEDLMLRRDRLMDEANAYQLKITQSKASLDSLTSLNNAIAKMSLHHKELKTSLMELQIVYESKLREKTSLEQSLRQLQLEESNFMERMARLKSI